jgi:alpha-beta hydrolase superfamily lysophospholipase
MSSTRHPSTGILSEMRYPSRWYSKLIATAFGLLCFGALASAAVAAYMVYRVVSPVSAESAVDLTNFPGHPREMTYNALDGSSRSGWFFPGLTSAPIVVLCPGYQTSRGETLPLAAAIQDHGYNVFVFDTIGSRGKQLSTLGYRETGELRAAVAAVSQRDDLDQTRIGYWGTDLGGYAALAAAEGDPRVKAIAVESPYDQPQDLANVLIDRQGMVSLPMLRSFARKEFDWLHHSERNVTPVSENLDRLAGVAKLFLSAPEEPALAQSTQQLYRMAPEPKDLIALSRGQYSGLVDAEKREYEDRLVTFFLANLPVEAPALAPATSATHISQTSAPAATPRASTTAR